MRCTSTYTIIALLLLQGLLSVPCARSHRQVSRDHALLLRPRGRSSSARSRSPSPSRTGAASPSHQAKSRPLNLDLTLGRPSSPPKVHHAASKHPNLDLTLGRPGSSSHAHHKPKKVKAAVAHPQAHTADTHAAQHIEADIETINGKGAPKRKWWNVPGFAGRPVRGRFPARTDEMFKKAAHGHDVSEHHSGYDKKGQGGGGSGSPGISGGGGNGATAT